MAERNSRADISWDDQLYIGRYDVAGGSTAIFTQIYGIETLPMPEKAPDDVDVTHQQSPGRSRETIPGLLAAADYSLEKQLWAEDEGDLLLDELASLTEAGSKEDVLIEFVVAGIRRTYRGYVNMFTPQAPVGEKRPVTVAFKIFERITPDPRVLP